MFTKVNYSVVNGFDEDSDYETGVLEMPVKLFDDKYHVVFTKKYMPSEMDFLEGTKLLIPKVHIGDLIDVERVIKECGKTCNRPVELGLSLVKEGDFYRFKFSETITWGYDNEFEDGFVCLPKYDYYWHVHPSIEQGRDPAFLSPMDVLLSFIKGGEMGLLSYDEGEIVPWVYTTLRQGEKYVSVAPRIEVSPTRRDESVFSQPTVTSHEIGKYSITLIEFLDQDNQGRKINRLIIPDKFKQFFDEIDYDRLYNTLQDWRNNINREGIDSSIESLLGRFIIK